MEQLGYKYVVDWVSNKCPITFCSFGTLLVLDWAFVLG